MGNPPYSISSNNKGEWISKLLDDYKKNLHERNIQPLSDDYIKFIRLAQYYVERNGEGVLAYICNNSFIDGLIHRQMRSELMRVFDKIYILDLHGNTRKKETAPDGSKDENVFDIMQGVSINIFIKKSGKSKESAIVRHFDLYGMRDHKYEYLRSHNFREVEWQTLNPQEPLLFFVPKDFEVQKEYEKGFRIDECMSIGTVGIATGADGVLVSFEKSALLKGVELQYSITPDADKIDHYSYRPFDNRYIYYDNAIVQRARFVVMKHMLSHKNIGFVVTKINRQLSLGYVFVSNYLADRHILDSAGDATSVFPLYLYPEEGSIDMTRRPNLDETIWAAINTAVGHETTPEDIFDYIYGVLHSPAYREKYKEFLKVDFPRIPYPKNADEFEHFRSFGNQLRELHLMHNVPESSVSFPFPGNMQVDYLRWEWNKDDGYSGNVWINDAQCFEGIPADAWEFYIGGYQPAQKWLKDRKGRTLSFDDIEHYRKIIAVLIETKRLMDEIDTIVKPE
jgi:predicted helicase